MADDLKAGFTGSPPDEPEGMLRAARMAGEAVKRETNALVSGAGEHPHTATSLVLGIGIMAFALGYQVGRSSAERNYNYWR